MEIRAIDEYNADGHLIYAENYPGAFVRGETREKAIGKFKDEILQYANWLGREVAAGACSAVVVQDKVSELQICDADSDVIFASEHLPLTPKEYDALKALALKSAKDFLTLYRSIPDKIGTTLNPRKTFYGAMPTSADEMYAHTKGVNDYYFGEIHVSATVEPDIYTCRAKGFETLESQPGFLENPVYEGSYGELWSLKKVCRRFVWHDRIHAKAMYKMAVKLCGVGNVKNPFCFVI